jgi:hypothetical protein
MLVSLDAEKGVVTIYGAAVIKIPITQMNKLRQVLRGKEVQYVQEVVPATGDEVLDLIQQMVDAGEVNTQPDPAEVSDGKLWMRATGSGQLYLPLNKKIKLQFEHPGEFVCLDTLGYDIFEKFPQVKALLDRKKLEVVSTSRMNQIKRLEAERVRQREQREFGYLVRDRDERTGWGDSKWMEVSSYQKEDEFYSEQERLVREMGLGKPESGDGQEEGDE